MIYLSNYLIDIKVAVNIILLFSDLTVFAFNSSNIEKHLQDLP